MEKGKKTSIFFVILAFFSLPAVHASGRDLVVPQGPGASMPVQMKISGILVDQSDLWLFPSDQVFLVKTPFNSKGKNLTEVFGASEHQLRVPIPQSPFPAAWRGLYGMGEQYVLWDSKMLQLLVVRKKDFTLVRSQTVPMDTIKPAIDRGGEATKSEISKLRKKFHDVYVKSKNDRFSGLVEMPVSWEKLSGRNFLIATRLNGFPLILMSCEQEDAASCVVARQCQLRGASPGLNAGAIGIAVNPDRRELLIANANSNSIEIFKYISCGNIKRVSDLRLPSKFPKIESLHVDSNQRLWIGTGIIDSSIDANLFYWEKEAWD